MGRPPLDADDPSVSVTVKLPSKQFDAVYERAQRERVTMAEIIRRDMREGKEKKKQ